ncbi:hypothetical protein H6F38_14835 [Paenibacillus sp. EKM208P]|nr:hypothetical protein H6F38_14835 [Paenibacillus sp. EKM208P]
MSLQLIDAIHNNLKADTELMAMLKLTPSSQTEEVTKRLTRGLEPEITISRDTIPHICMYVMPGRFAANPLVFEGKFCLDFYGKTAHESRLLFERSFKLIHDRRLSAQGFMSYLCVLAYDSDFATGIQGAKGYKAIFDVDYLRMN